MNQVYTYQFPKPDVTVDIVLWGKQVGDIGFKNRYVLLIQRGKDPFKGMWALPGGYWDLDEDLHHAACRELREETGVTGIALKQLHTFGKPGRDPRGPTVSVTFFASVYCALTDIKAADDAVKAQWFPAKALPPLAFDHRDIIQYALANT